MKKVLVISPHMDDEVLGTGGIICKYIEEGFNVKVCFVCNRAYGHKYKKEWIDEQKSNSLEAKKALGYHDHTFLDLNDEQLDKKLIDVIIPLEKTIKVYEPQILYLPHGGDNNQDHRAVFKAAMVALRTFSTPFVEAIYSYEVMSSTDQAARTMANVFLPNYYVDISRYIDKKIKAMNSYQKEKRRFPHPRSTKALGIWAMKRGIEVNMEFAEAFSVVRMIERIK